MEKNMNKLLDRFFNYVSIDTQSKPNSRHCPRTDGESTLAKLIYKELIALGLEDVTLDKNCYIMATLPANVDGDIPTIGFVAHLDTAPDFTGKNVQPSLIEGYRGGDVALGIGDEVLSPVRFPFMHDLIGQSLIITDGNTLLGADNKAGVAEIITAIDELKNSDIPHGKIRIAFTPDEEIGRGANLFDVEKFGAQWAYTVDGGPVGELEYENFNAANATVKVQGNNVHPGTAKDVMVNAMTVAAKFHLALPSNETPECTDGYEGFNHLKSMKGNVESAELSYIVRDFCRDNFEKRKQLFLDIAEKLNADLPTDCKVEVILEDCYFNMKEKVEPFPHIIEIAKNAMENCDIEPVIKPIRGGTDGARLSFKGLPCPNIFTGGYNFHSKHEFITVEGMEKAVKVIKEIARLTTEHK